MLNRKVSYLGFSVDGASPRLVRATSHPWFLGKVGQLNRIRKDTTGGFYPTLMVPESENM